MRRYNAHVSAVYIALPFALLLALLFLAAFIWAVRSGQMDDLETPAHRILGEDEERKPSAENRKHTPQS
jgi:cbb3-type cytochrome oxidase maturation protein